ncbi:hypothetical protein Bca101_002162 [Brassica carinata]
MEYGSGSGSGSSRRRPKSGRRLCSCALEATIYQAWTEKNPGRRFYDGTLWQKRALLEARDEIREQSLVIEQLKETIAELRSNLEKKENEDEIVRKFEEFFV